MEQGEDDGCGGKTEGDVVSQGVELFAYGGGNSEQTSREAVEEVEEGSYDDEEECCLKLMTECEPCGYAPGQEVAAGEGVGNMFFHILSKIILGPGTRWVSHFPTLCASGREFGYHGLIANGGLSHFYQYF